MIFNVTLEKAEDGWIVAECPALPGCVSQGKDEKEALENIKEAITAWLWAENQKALKKLPKKSAKRPIVVTVWTVTRLANISGKKAARAFQKAGWRTVGQVGSHLVLVKEGIRANLSIPQHKELSVGTLRALIRNAGMTVEEFIDLL
jgi:predicted RNase H-like HicB family nuclease/predicted RNA binding protein YcfA (HicA-like mRNA interferase family)